MLRSADDFPVIVLLGGLEAAGRSETANLLNEWMDPRWIVTRAWDLPSDEERERPPFWRYWRSLPPRGRIGLFLNAWYGPAIHDRIAREYGKDAFKSRLDRIPSSKGPWLMMVRSSSSFFFTSMPSRSADV